MQIRIAPGAGWPAHRFMPPRLDLKNVGKSLRPAGSSGGEDVQFSDLNAALALQVVPGCHEVQHKIDELLDAESWLRPAGWCTNPR